MSSARCGSRSTLSAIEYTRSPYLSNIASNDRLSRWKSLRMSSSSPSWRYSGSLDDTSTRARPDFYSFRIGRFGTILHGATRLIHQTFDRLGEITPSLAESFGLAVNN